MIIAYCDGGYDNIRKRNPYASVKIYRDDKQIYHAHKITVDASTNNEAEYQALILCLQYLTSYTDWLLEETIIFSDSKLLVNQVNNKWKINYINLYNLKNIVDSIKVPFNLIWVPREKIVEELGH